MPQAGLCEPPARCLMRFLHNEPHVRVVQWRLIGDKKSSKYFIIRMTLQSKLKNIFGGFIYEKGVHWKGEGDITTQKIIFLMNLYNSSKQLNSIQKQIYKITVIYSVFIVKIMWDIQTYNNLFEKIFC